MAQINPNIALSFQMPQIQDPLVSAARAQDIGVNALKLQELQRGIQEEEQLRNYLAGADLAKPETRAGLAKFGKTGLAYGKALSEQEKTGLETKKLRGQVDEQALKMQRERISDLAFNPSDANITAHLEDAILRGEMSPDQAKQMWAQVSAMPANQRKELLLQMGTDVNKRLEQMTVSEAQKQQMGVTMRGQDIAAATARRGQDIQADPELQARIAEAKQFGDTLGKNRATAQLALPNAIETANEGIRLIDEMVGKREIKDASGKVIQQATKPHPGFRGYVGSGFSIANGITVPGQRFVEGSDVASFDIRQKQIEGRAFLEAFQALKGGGSITEKEGEKGTAAIMRMNKASSEREYIAAARELQDIMAKGVERAKAKASGGATTPATTAPAGNVIDFNSLK